MKELKIKVCGMRDPENISGVVTAGPDYLGFIFYPESKRFVGADFSYENISIIPKTIKKVGVFVNEIPGIVLNNCQCLDLDVVQLHGNEIPEYCRHLRQAGITVFKAFSVDENFNFEILKAYSGVCDYFLFDTKGHHPGGTGQKFNWQLLENYTGKVPFFLSGGIGPDDLEALQKFNHPQFFGVDVNSGFEISPALKDVEKVKIFIEKIKTKKGETV
ncbi:MAG: phosphoribosylanthranilate isomerase [Prolixibacteraceae bacterium]